METISFKQLTDKDIFIGAGGKGDIRALAFWRVGDMSTGTAIQVRPPEFTDVEQGGVKSGTFFGLEDKVELILTRG